MTLSPPSPWTKRLVHSSLFLLLLLAAPGAAHAEGMGLGFSSAPAYRPGTEAATPLRLLDEPTPAAPPQSQYTRPPRPLAERILAEAGLGVGVPVAIIMGTGVATALFCPSGSQHCLGSVLLVATPLSILGLPLGVWLGGRLTGGQGYFLGALLGAATGALAGGAAVYVTSRNTEAMGPLVLSILFALVAPLAGSIAGYELSASLGSTETTGTDAVHLRPLLGALPGGAAMGVHGTF